MTYTSEEFDKLAKAYAEIVVVKRWRGLRASTGTTVNPPSPEETR